MTAPVSVLIPVYGAEDLLRDCLESLAAFLPPLCDVHVMDDASPGGGAERVVQEFQGRIAELHYTRRPENLGFVRNCNEGMLELRASGRDVLLLNSDTRITAGAVEEMHAVLHLHEMHGAVTPRSNSATIYSIPVFEKYEPEKSYALWCNLKPHLNRYQMMPTSVGFCMLIRSAMIEHFGVFDTAYGPGYNEENDLVCRMNQHGYSAVAANWAFVYHMEGSSFGERRKQLEKRNREILNRRYPNYTRVVNNYFRHHMDPVDRFAAVWTEPRKKRILFDLYHLTAKHSGTSEFGLSLLLHLAPKLGSKYDVVLGLSEEGRNYFESELIGYPVLDEVRGRDKKFDLLFKPCQMFAWQEIYRAATLAPRICLTHQDSIAARCRYIAGPAPEILQHNLPLLADRIVTISDFSKRDFETFYGLQTAWPVIYQGVHAGSPSPTPPDGHVLVVGNHFKHKAVDQTVAELAGMEKVVVLGGGQDEKEQPGIRWRSSGNLGRAEIDSLFAGAAVVVYPSYYEGFGLPVLDSLALRRHVVVLDTPVNRELEQLAGHDEKLHIVKTHKQMRGVIEDLLEHLREHGGALTETDRKAACGIRTWDDVSREYAVILEETLERPVDVEKLRYRWNFLSAMDSYCPLQ